MPVNHIYEYFFVLIVPFTHIFVNNKTTPKRENIMKANIINQRIGAELKNQRKMKKITQEQLSEKTGIGRTAIAKYETGTITISMEAFVTICNAIGINYADVLEGIETE